MITVGSPTYGPPIGIHSMGGVTGTTTVAVATAWGPPLRLIV